ncbi:MAG: hypothetical protein KAS19_12140, partial [Anaerolineales bacterium]|nr:hypothetical protein [Anaerolineales bacterium]
MRLYQLLEDQPELIFSGLPDLKIMNLTADSLQVVPGSLFVAVRGSVSDGHNYILDAVTHGAIVVVGEEPDPGLGVPYLRVSDSRMALAHLAAA